MNRTRGKNFHSYYESYKREKRSKRDFEAGVIVFSLIMKELAMQVKKNWIIYHSLKAISNCSNSTSVPPIQAF